MESNLDKLKSEFAAVLAHQLKDPLTTAREAVEMLKDRLAGKINQKEQKMLEIALKNLDQLSNVIDRHIKYFADYLG
jgi:signal transduction histidine kinase